MTDLSVEEVVGDMRHLVEERVGANGVVRRKHQIGMERHLDHDPPGAVRPGHHLTQPSREAVGKSDRHCGR